MTKSARLFRTLLTTMGMLVVALMLARPFTAQQPLPPYDEAQIIQNLTSQLQLDQPQVERLREILAAHRPQFDKLREQSRGVPGNGLKPEELRAAFERERRAVGDELMPRLSQEQQAKFRTLLSAPPPGPAASMIAPLKPKLPDVMSGVSGRLIAPRRITTASRRHPVSSSLLSKEQKILHLLNRAGYGPRPGDVERVRKIGIEQYLDEQLHPENIADDLIASPILMLGTLQLSTPEIIQAFAPPPPTPSPTPTPTPAPATAAAAAANAAPPAVNPDNKVAKDQAQVKPPTPAPLPPRPPRNPQQPIMELQQARLLRAVFSERQLQEVMTDFWLNHFNVFAGKDLDRWLLTAYERDAIRPHALGKFRDLLLATAQSPAMLYYLDNHVSRADGAQQPRLDPMPKPKEGAVQKPAAPASQPPPRRPGLNENYGRELMELHTLGVDGGYTQNDVIAVARCFTGWTIEQQPNYAFVFRPWWHDRNEKTVLGTRFPAGGGMDDGLRVLDLLAHHPSTARFISRQLCQRFVADEPPAALVNRVATVFTKTDGDLRAVVKAILTSPEFYALKYYRTKIKSPLELVASSLRATGAMTDGYQPILQWVARLGEPLYQCVPPTGYGEESARWINPGTLLDRLNFTIALLQNRIAGTRVEPEKLINTAASVSQDETLNHLIALLIHADVSAETRTALHRVWFQSSNQIEPAKFEHRTTEKNTAQPISQLMTLILGSREFQVK